MNRREFLRSAAASAAFAAQGRVSGAMAAEATTRPASATGKLARRPYGKTGLELSIIGFPGFALKDVDQDEVNRVVRRSVERGMNYFDIAPLYGNSQEKLGEALEPFRKDVFLACKTDKRDRAGAETQLKDSLKKLRTDHFELYQLHYITSVKDDVDVAFGKGGAMEVLIEARKAGIVKYLGFSAHSVEAAVAAMDRFDFDSALFPVNYASMTKGRFGEQILKKAQEKGVACMAIKALARQKWGSQDSPRRRKYSRCWYEPTTDARELELSLRYTLSQPITSAVPPADLVFLDSAIDVALDFRQITRAEEDALKALAANWDPIFRHA